MIILAREFARMMPNVPLLFATRDRNLFNAVQFIGIHAYLYQGFPITGIQTLTREISPEVINWDKILQDIQSDTEKKLVQVELTLVSKGCAPRWIRRLDNSVRKNMVIVAEGTGVIHAVTNIRFSWTLPFVSWDFPSPDEDYYEESGADGEGEPADPQSDKLSPGISFLDFGGFDNSISPNLYKALVRKLNNCASPLAYIEDMPTVQDPVSVMKQFLIYEFMFQEKKLNSELTLESLEEFEEKLDNQENLLNWAYYWLRDRETNKEEIDVSFSEFLHAMRSCWSIGETIMINLMDIPAELTNLKGETEE